MKWNVKTGKGIVKVEAKTRTDAMYKYLRSSHHLRTEANIISINKNKKTKKRKSNNPFSWF